MIKIPGHDREWLPPVDKLDAARGLLIGLPLGLLLWVGILLWLLW